MRHLERGPWALDQGELRRFSDQLDSSLEAASAGSVRRPERPAPRAEGSVVILPVRGVLQRKPNLASLVMGLSTYRDLEREIRGLAADSDVAAILLEVDTPGGDALGLAELSAAIVEAREAKPVVAFVSGLAASAGYLIASAAGRVVAAPDAILGSIGVVAVVVDVREAEKQAGIEVFEIVSSQSPRKRPDPKTEAGLLQILEEVDSLAGVFVDTVARNRGVPSQRVLESFGQGGSFVGAKAVAAGLADSVGSLAALTSELAGIGSEQNSRLLPAAPEGDVDWDQVVAEAGPAFSQAQRLVAPATSYLSRSLRPITLESAAKWFVESLQDQGVSPADAMSVVRGDTEVARRLGVQTPPDVVAAEARHRSERIAAREADEHDLPEITPSDGDALTAENDSSRRVAGVVSMAQRLGLAPKEEAR